MKAVSKGFIILLLVSVFYPLLASGPKEKETFEYRADKIRDPFVPPILIKAPEKGKVKESQRGYDLEELRLVGVLSGGKDKFALMEDKEGKGLLLRKGDRLNEETWVQEIERDRVVFALKLRGEVKRITIEIPK